VDVSVADKQNGKYGQQVSVEPGEKLYFRISALNRYGRPLVAVCDIPMLKYQGKDVLLPGQMGSMTLTAKCLQPGTFKPAVCLSFVDPTTGSIAEVDDSCLVVCAEPGDEPTFEIGGDQQQGGLDKGGGQQQTGGQQPGGQQQTGSQQPGASQQGGGPQPGLASPVFSLLGGQQQSGSQQQSSGGSPAAGQQGGSNSYDPDRKGNSGSKGQDRKGNSGSKGQDRKGRKGKHGDR
jgi:hypothetical protein